MTMKNTLRLFATLVPLLCLAQADAQTRASAPVYRWRPVAIGGGGFITAIDADRSGKTRLAVSDVYGAYVWNEASDRWAQLVTAASMPREERRDNLFAKGVYALAVAPSDPSRIYMAVGGAVYYSRDGGRSFSKSAGPFPVFFNASSAFRMYGPFLAVSPADPGVAFLGTPHDGLLRTRDGGATWTKVASVPPGRDIPGGGETRSPGVLAWFGKGKYANEIWALSAGNGMFRSRDGGASFVPLADASAAQPKSLKRGAFGEDGVFYGVDAESRTVWKFDAGGWSDLSARPGLKRGAFSAVAVRRDGKVIFVFGLGGDAHLSRDGGATWQHLSHMSMPDAGEPPWLRIANQAFFATAQVSFDHVLPDRLWVGAGTGPYYADVPDGTSRIVWKSRARGIEELVANDVIQPPGQAPLFGGWDFGVHVKDDLDAFSRTYGPKERMLIAVQQMDWSSADPAFIVTNASDTRTFCCSGDGDAVLAGYSRDSGKTWAKFPHLPTPPGTQASDPWRMSFGAIAVSAGDTNNIVWAPSFHRSPYATRDRGTTWTRVALEGEKLPNTGSHVRFHFQRKTLVADRVRSGRFYLFHSGDGDNPGLAGLWRSDDGGARWEKIFRGEISPSSRFSAKLRSVPGKEGHLFFTSAVPGNPAGKLMRSTDGGAHWDAVLGADRVLDIAFGRAAPGAAYPAIYVAGYISGAYGIWRSTDNAAHWSRIGRFPVGSLDLVTAMEADKDRFGRVYLGFEGSGWAYGEPSGCKPAAFSFADREECFSDDPGEPRQP